MWCSVKGKGQLLFSIGGFSCDLKGESQIIAIKSELLHEVVPLRFCLAERERGTFEILLDVVFPGPG